MPITPTPGIQYDLRLHGKERGSLGQATIHNGDSGYPGEWNAVFVTSGSSTQTKCYDSPWKVNAATEISPSELLRKLVEVRANRIGAQDATASSEFEKLVLIFGNSVEGETEYQFSVPIFAAYEVMKQFETEAIRSLLGSLQRWEFTYQSSTLTVGRQGSKPETTNVSIELDTYPRYQRIAPLFTPDEKQTFGERTAAFAEDSFAVFASARQDEIGVAALEFIRELWRQTSLQGHDQPVRMAEVIDLTAPNVFDVRQSTSNELAANRLAESRRNTAIASAIC